MAAEAPSPAHPHGPPPAANRRPTHCSHPPPGAPLCRPLRFHEVSCCSVLIVSRKGSREPEAPICSQLTVDEAAVAIKCKALQRSRLQTQTTSYAPHRQTNRPTDVCKKLRSERCSFETCVQSVPSKALKPSNLTDLILGCHRLASACA